MKTAEIVSIGEELLAGLIADTNAQAIGSLLQEMGILHGHRQTVGDDIGSIRDAITLAMSRSDIVFTIGGLGPTQDDLTRDGIASALGEEMVFEPEFAEKLKRLFLQRGLPWVESQVRQAWRPQSAAMLPNPNGSAPGLWCERDGKVVVALPGPKGEFGPMLAGPVRERLGPWGSQGLATRLLKVCELGESVVEEMLGDLMRPLGANLNPSPPAPSPRHSSGRGGSDAITVAPYAKPGEVHLKLTAWAETRAEAEAKLDPVEAEIRAILGDRIFGGSEDTLEGVVLELLQGLTLATAESITGGGIAQRLTGVPGASQVFKGGAVVYAVPAKASVLGIQPETLAKHGPVSAEVAREMAESVTELMQADWAVAATGNAGPTSDVDGKPVGLVYIAVASPHQGVVVQEHKFRGDRSQIRFRTEQAALTLLRRAILQPPVLEP